MEEVTKYNSNETGMVAYSPEDVMNQVVAIQSLMSKAMHEGEHFGKIPGCGDKPTLLKAGAEKLSFMFRLAPRYEIKEKDLSKGHREYEIITDLIHIPSGKSFGQGVGSCSTMESKYRYRNSALKCPECGKETIIKGKKEYGGGYVCFERKGGCKAKFLDTDERIINQEVGRVEYENPADYYNTVLKMAKKRSLVDATLTATAASDIFTQDVEELVENGVISVSYTEVKEEQKPENKTKQQTKQPESKPERNYTAEALNCQTLKDLKAWYESLNDKEKKDYAGLYKHTADEIKKIVTISKEIQEIDAITLINDEDSLRKRITQVDCNKEIREKALRFLSDKIASFEQKKAS